MLNLVGTMLSSVVLPATEYLEEVHLPGTLTSLSLDQQPNLKTITLEGADRMQSLSIGAGLQIRVPYLIYALQAMHR